MGTRTVRLDDESERALAEIREATGLSTSGALKHGLVVARKQLEAEAPPSAWEVYSQLDLGEGGYARAPAHRAKPALREILGRKHGR